LLIAKIVRWFYFGTGDGFYFYLPQLLTVHSYQTNSLLHLQMIIIYRHPDSGMLCHVSYRKRNCMGVVVGSNFNVTQAD
jgi:hypothetical protein